MPASIDPKIRAQVLAHIEDTGCTAVAAARLFGLPPSTVSTWLRRDPLATVDGPGEGDEEADELPPMGVAEYADLQRVDMLRRKIAEAERAARMAISGQPNWSAWTQISKLQLEWHAELQATIQARATHEGLDEGGPDAIARQLLVAADLLRAMGGEDLIPEEARPREAVDARALLAELGLDPDTGPSEAAVERFEDEVSDEEPADADA